MLDVYVAGDLRASTVLDFESSKGPFFDVFDVGHEVTSAHVDRYRVK